MGLDYRSAGVDKEAGYKQVELIKNLVRQTYSSNVISDLGGFSAMYRPNIENMEEPVLVSGTDGVGTKLLIGQDLGVHDTVGIDLVAMCVNDILCQGAKPLFFLDYIATGKLDPSKMASIVKGIAEACKEAGASLIGGETAEMPGMYGEDDYDLAGFAVGIVDKRKIITGRDIIPSDIAIGLPSSGLHSNGFSLVRAILEKNNIAYDSEFNGSSLGQVLLEPTKIYAKEILSLIKNINIKGICHITGGGLYENIPRVLPQGLSLSIKAGNIPKQAIFSYLKELGDIEEKEMYSTFNMGVGMVVFVSEDEKYLAMDHLAKFNTNAFELGYVLESKEGVIIND